MEEKQASREAVIQILQDAGCESELIERYLRLRSQHAFREQKKLLRKHRAALLEAIHGEQKKLDCLDDLLYLLGKEKRENP